MRPLRILHIANLNLFKYGAWYMNLDAKLSMGLTQLGHAVYNVSHRDMARAEGLFKSKALGTKAMRKGLLKTVDNFKPELVILGHSELIDSETLKELRAKLPGVPVVMWYCDPMLPTDGVEYEVPILSERSSLLDAIFTTSGVGPMNEIIQHACTAAHVPNWVHPGCESATAFANQTYANDLIYAGTDYELTERKALLQGLVDSEIGPRFKLFQALGNPRVHGNAYYSALADSLMGLSISRRYNIPWYTSDRMQQMMGNGLCTISPRTEGLTTLFKDNEAVWFDDQAEIVELVKWHARNPKTAQAIGERGWRAAHQRCAASRVAKFMIEVAFEQPLSEDYEWADQLTQPI